jgi:hypothetical protein
LAVTAVPVEHGTMSGLLASWNRSMALSATPVLQKPMVATTFSLISSCDTLRPWSGLAVSSLITSSSGRPRYPPTALISSTASLMPLSMGTPKSADAPVKGPTTPIRTGVVLPICAFAGNAAATPTSRPAQAASR